MAGHSKSTSQAFLQLIRVNPKLNESVMRYSMIERFLSAIKGLRKQAPGTLLQAHDSYPAPTVSVTARLAELPPGRKGISFFVDDVEPSAKPLWLSTLGESLEVRSGAKIVIMPDRNVPSLAFEGYVRAMERAYLDYPDFVPPRRATWAGVSLHDPTPFSGDLGDHTHWVHPLVHAVHQAFCDHRPLVLSPDAIWLTIVQGFAQHLQQNSETFRNRIVPHHGKKQLRVETLSLEPTAWPQLIAQLCAQIRDNSDPFLYETLDCEFTTTTPTIRTASRIALMETYCRYYEHVAAYVCGIPKITLEGTSDDWRRIRDRVQVLATFDFEWWTHRLTPILDEFVSTANGVPDLRFWEAIYKPKEVYGDELVRGWICDLFPYLGSAKLYRNGELETERIDWVQPESPSNRFPGVSLEAFPNGISRVPVTVESPGNRTTPVELLGGFFGVSQSPNDNALAPIISWAVVEKDTRTSPPGLTLEELEKLTPEELENLIKRDKEKMRKRAAARNPTKHSAP
jgi:hypothetical protein